jgi:CheY-like chemotaxis protein/plasmid maintenance system antidote protein VapI
VELARICASFVGFKISMPLISKVGHTVRKLRREMGLSQEELAERADLHRTYIAGIERGGRNITLRSVERLATALGVSVAHLLNESHDGASSDLTSANLSTEIIDILLVEDNPEDAELTTQALSNGHLVNRVHVVRDGQQALDFMFCEGDYANRRGRPLPQLILLDITLPKISGSEVLQHLKRDRRTRNVAVIMLTISNSSAHMEECKRLGVEQYILKPVAFKEFASVVQQFSFMCALLKPGAKGEHCCAQ